MLKSRKRLIIILVILGVFALLLILGSALFSLRGVTVDFASGETLNSYSKDDVIKAGNFPFGRNILFLNYDANIERIEQAFPYAKVNSVRRHFPNKLVVYISERAPAFRIELSSGNWAILDNELKVLKVVSSESELSAGSGDTPGEISLPIWKNFGATSVTLGKKLNLEYQMSLIKDIKQVAESQSIGLNIYNLKSIELIQKSGEPDVVSIIMDDGPTINITGTNNFSRKVANGFVNYQTEGVGKTNWVITVNQDGTVNAGLKP